MNLLDLDELVNLINVKIYSKVEHIYLYSFALAPFFYEL